MKQEIELLKNKQSYSSIVKGIVSAPPAPENSNDQQCRSVPALGRPSQKDTPQNNSSTTKPSSQSSASKTVLIMGDSIIQRINPRGLLPNVHKHAISGGTIKDILNDIHSFNLCQFQTVILYIGGNDLSRTSDHELIEELYDQLIAVIKASNPNIRIVLCKIAPRGDVDVNILNMIVERLSAHHALTSVDIYKDFHDRNGNLQMRFLSQQDHIHPSPSGIKRILGSMHIEVNLVAEFSQCTFSQGHGQRSGNKTHNNFQRPSNVLGKNQHRKPQQRCMKCSNTSHNTFECRLGQPVKCWSCGLLGHKQDSCWNSF